MSKMNVDIGDEKLTTCGRGADAGPEVTVYVARETELGGGLTIRRALPTAKRRMIGAWCFLDHFGPMDLEDNKGMDVAPHPHIGLQTVTWLTEGEVLHRDSIGSEQIIRPGQLNVMTSGRGISHSEESPTERTDPNLHGLQFWVALPEGERERDPDFEHHADLPTLTHDSLEMTVMVGESMGERSPATMYSEMMGVDVAARDVGERTLDLRTGWEHGVLVIEGALEVDGTRIEPGKLAYLGTKRDRVRLANDAPARFILLGGAPFEEEIMMWWNFVARTPDEIERARRDWQERAAYFGDVSRYRGSRLDAPSWRQRPVKRSARDDD